MAAVIRRNQRMEFFSTSDRRTLVAKGLKGGAIGVSRIRYDGSDYSPVSPPDQEAAVVAHLHLKPQVAEISVDGRPPAAFTVGAGRLNLLDFRSRFHGRIHRPFDFVAFHIPFSAFEDLAGERVMDGLAAGPTDGLDDAQTRGLAAALAPAFERPQEASRLFVDYVGWALAAHVGARYGRFAGPEARPPGRLARWQEKRALEMVEANLGGDLRLAELAAACGLSVGHFARAFRVTIGMTPHCWLLYRRVERAKALMLDRDLPLAAIAGACGFSDQSHMSRVFRRLTGITPARWRREQGAGVTPDGDAYP